MSNKFTDPAMVQNEIDTAKKCLQNSRPCFPLHMPGEGCPKCDEYDSALSIHAYVQEWAATYIA